MPDKKPTDSEIVKAKEVSLKEQIEHYNKRRKEVFDNYFRRNTEGAEDPLEICVLRESAVLISKLESIINRLQAENERLQAECDKQYEIAEATIRAEIADGGTSCHWCEDTISGVAKAEAYKECIEKVKERSDKTELVCSGASLKTNYTITKNNLDNLLKEMVGEDDGKEEK